jgi:hypothetical protein
MAGEAELSEMVERGAKALFERDKLRPQLSHLLFGDPPRGWDDLAEELRAIYREQTREVVSAIREPTEAMCQAAFDDGWVAMATDLDDFARWWRAMNDAALKA